VAQRPAESPFEEALLPHLDAAYNLARWLTHNDQDAEDVVQEAYLRALRFFGGFRGGDGRGWLLAIVRNACHDWMQRRAGPAPTMPFDEEIHGPEVAPDDPETLLVQRANQQIVRRALEALPPLSREVLVLRELEGLSYQEIARMVAIPVGTVMSRLARARARLQQQLAGQAGEESGRELH
jgi:RNA polymerase sigma factor (sigma-70 family)